MNICTPEHAATGSAHLPALFFEATRRKAELRPVAMSSVERPFAPEARQAREEKQAQRFALVLGVTAFVAWGMLVQTLVASLWVPSFV